MLMQILTRTPPWVWGLLAALVAVGVSQSLPRRVTLRRATLVPVLLVTLSLGGVVSTFASTTLPVAAWTAGLALALVAGARLVPVRGARWDAANARFEVPGSLVPLALILSLFAIKYGVGIALALHRALVADPLFGASIGVAYGLFSGLFLARSASLWHLARTARPVAA